MEYRTVTAFMDMKDNGYVYCSDDRYPRDGLEPTQERIEELAGSNNKRGMPLIEAVKEEESEGEKKEKITRKRTPKKEE